MDIQKQSYGNFLKNIKRRIRDAQYRALQAVNKEQIQLYWDIGKMIVDKQEEQAWGKSVVEYALRNSNQPIGVATYSMYSELPKEWKNLLPSPEQITEGLKIIEETPVLQKSRDDVSALVAALVKLFKTPEYNNRIYNTLAGKILKKKKKTG